jgi:photosystem II stability/assembly factor-like uncharacterized protein
MESVIARLNSGSLPRYRPASDHNAEKRPESALGPSGQHLPLRAPRFRRAEEDSPHMIAFDRGRAAQKARAAKALVLGAPLAALFALFGNAEAASPKAVSETASPSKKSRAEEIRVSATSQLQRAGQFNAEKASRDATLFQKPPRSIFDEDLLDAPANSSADSGAQPELLPGEASSAAPGAPKTLEETAREMEESGSLYRNVLTRNKAGHRVHPKHPGQAWDWFMEKRVPKGERRLPDFYRHDALLETYRHNMDRDSLREESRAAAWTPIVPTGGVQPSGRMVEIAVHPTNDQIIYGASASGGLWKTTNRGGQWVNVTDGWIPTLGMGSVAIDPFNPETVYCGLGEGVPGGTYEPFGAGIYRSINGGASWALVPGTSNFRYVTDIEVSSNSQTILATVKGLSDGSGGGLYITENGGNSWFTPFGTFPNFSFFDISVDPANRNNVLATEGQTNTPSFTDFGYIYASNDGGASFIETFPGSTGFSNANVNRIELARGPNGRVFAIVGGSDSSLLGLLGSDDGGLTWGLPALGGVPPAGQQYSPSQMTYNLTVAVSPTNPNLVYFGSNLRMFRSLDSGNNFAFVADWSGDDGLPYVHADHHCIRFGASDQTVYCANDGGFFYSLNGGATWTEANHGYTANQIYRIDNSRTNENVLLYGCQDNDKYVRRADGAWRHYPNTFGDGMDMIAYDPDPNTLMGTNQFGNVIGLTQDGGDNWVYVRVIGDGSSGIPGDERGHWLSPFINDPQNPGNLYFGLQNIWRATYTPGFAPQWSPIVNVPSQFPVIGLMDHLAITAGPEPRKLVGFLGRANNAQGGLLFDLFNINLDGSGAIQEFLLPSTTGWVNALETDPNDKNVVWVGYSNLNSSQVGVMARIWRSPNLGQNWVDMTNNFPRNLPVSAIFVDPQNSNTVIVGSDVGAYRSDDGGNTWVYWSDGLPPVVISDFAYYPPTRKLRAATYGRGAWETPLEGGASLALSFSAIPSLNGAGGWTFQSGEGSFTAATTPGEVGGLQITHPAPQATSILISYTGIWANNSRTEFQLADNAVYAARATISNSVANTFVDGAKPRLRLEPVAPFGIDYSYTINENNALSPFHPSPAGSDYVAYFRPFDLATNGQAAFVFDLASAGAEAGFARTVAMSSLEVATGNPSAFEGSANAIASGTFAAGQFGSWTVTDLGEGNFGGIVIWENSGTLFTGDGRLTWSDPNEPSGVSSSGGADLLGAQNPDQIEFNDGAFYWNRFEIQPSDIAGDGNYPSVQIEARPANPSLQAANTLRTDGDHYDGVVASGANGLYDLFWVAPDNGLGGGSGNNEDDLIIGFNLFNANPVPSHGGAVTLHSARTWVIGPNDPNNP